MLVTRSLVTRASNWEAVVKCSFFRTRTHSFVSQNVATCKRQHPSNPMFGMGAAPIRHRFRAGPEVLHHKAIGFAALPLVNQLQRSVWPQPIVAQHGREDRQTRERLERQIRSIGAWTISFGTRLSVLKEMTRVKSFVNLPLRLRRYVNIGIDDVRVGSFEESPVGLRNSTACERYDYGEASAV
jgi:hypothetical protein